MTLATDHDFDGDGLSGEARELLSIREAVLDHWESLVRAQIKGAAELLGPALTDNLPNLYDNLAEAISPGRSRETATQNTTAAMSHGSERARLTCFGPDEVLREYQLFRDAIRDVAQVRGMTWSPDVWATIARSIEIAACESLREFAATHEALRRRVAAALSHDMRAPLAVIATGAQLVALTSDIELARRSADKIRRHAMRLESMMGELLDALTVQRAQLPPLALSSFDMHELASEVARQFGEQGGGPFTIAGESVTGHWCAPAMRRALENLLTNAVKYGTGGEVRITVATERGRLSLAVHNMGPAIPEERRERIFGYLFRYGGPSTVGWGIGLPFVRDVAEGHGGSVSVDSSEEAGTTFTIDVPVDCRPFLRHAVNCAAPARETQEPAAISPVSAGGQVTR
ncbi:sensor histidine kinase [Pseudoduganella lutea]|uniref:histidine kinase n=1 Tax=Pseudoduganella lutea TaxID=321985 RepID=A0A4P6KTM9_9BURK|nr:HAMP domain-containing sensor histidine kinase [Pseudoduganella lutea]QBE62136.1 HAMP domain-containing histidine kinase [Pseudoduganella lutea]